MGGKEGRGGETGGAAAIVLECARGMCVMWEEGRMPYTKMEGATSRYLIRRMACRQQVLGQLREREDICTLL